MTNTPHTPKTKRYQPMSGWINVQLESDVDAKLREMAAKRRPKVTLTALIESGIEREWEAWIRDAKTEKAEKGTV